MPVNPKALRNWFAVTGIALLVVVLGFYAYARYRINRIMHEIPSKLGLNVQQSTKGFTLSKSEGGKTLFTISANNAVQYKDNQRAALKDVRILVYGRGAGTENAKNAVYDQIYGKEFDYDQSTGEVTAMGEVIIDLEAKGKPSENPTDSDAMPGAIHLKTSGLVFNQKTGLAQTNEKIEFVLPQARGFAVGAVYDSKEMSLRLKSDVNLHTAAQQPARPAQKQAINLSAANILANSAMITDDPRQAVLEHVRVKNADSNGAKESDLTANRVTIALRDDNTVEHVLASGDVNASATNRKSADITRVQTSEAKFSFNNENDIKTAVLSGGVKLDSSGSAPMKGTAGRVVIDFTGKNQIAKVRASESVHFQQGAKPANSDAPAKGAATAQDMQLQADTMDFYLKPGNRLERAVTSGASQIVLNSQPGASKTKTAIAGSHTVVTANQFEAGFAAKNRIQSLRGTGGTKIISSTPGAPDRISSSRELNAQFDPARNGAISAVEQEGDLKYSEGQRTATADRARFVASEDTLSLIGSARVQDTASGLTLTADTVRLNRGTGESNAEGNVKTTYNQLKPNPSGALLASQGSDPVHATAASMIASRNADTARYSGGARLWQGANIIEAPVIVFDRGRRALTASNDGSGSGKVPGVETIFVQTDKSGKTTPVAIKANKFTYSDNDRRAQFDGKVRLKTSETTMTAEHVDVLLRAKAKSAKTGSNQDSASQVEEIIADGPIEIEQQNPLRKATGKKLIYTASDGKFVLTGEPGKPPSIFDAERGDVTGDSLTFYSRDDRVQIGSGESSRTVTRTRIKDKSKP